jgi:hypothetical protein
MFTVNCCELSTQTDRALLLNLYMAGSVNLWLSHVIFGLLTDEVGGAVRRYIMFAALWMWQ